MRPPSLHLLRVCLVLLFAVLPLTSTRPVQGNPISGWKWSSIGPEKDCCFFQGGETGRATAIAANPQNRDDIWVGTAGGGVWHFVSGKWYPMSDNQASLAIGSLALAGCSSSGCSKIYAGTGENAIRRDTYYGAGLLEGTISGNSVAWTLHKGQAGPPAFDFTHGSIYNVVLDPTTSGASQVLYITLSSGVTASATESTVTAGPPLGGWGIYKSSNDGNDWIKLPAPFGAVPQLSVRPTDLEIDAANPLVLYAGFLKLGLFKSTDGGNNWCPLNPGIPRPAGCPMTYGLPDPRSTPFDHVEADIYRLDHNHLYASFGNCPDRFVGDCEPSIYESTNGGLNWTLRYTGSSTATPSGDDPTCPRGYTRYTHGLTIAPSNPATIFVTGYHLCESDDHGASWTPADHNDLGGTLHPDHHALVFHATDTTRVYDTNDGGVALSQDGGANWTPSTYGLSAFEFQSLATSPETEMIFGGTQDNGGVAWWPGTKQWTNLRCCGDGGFAAYETFNVGGLYDKTDLYITSNLNGLSDLAILPLRSVDGGDHWPGPGVPPVTYDLGLNGTEARSFYPPLVIAGGYEMFATNRLYTSVDQLFHWTSRSPTLSSDPESEIFSLSDVITAIAVAPSNPSRWYLGYYSGKVYYTDGACSTLSCWTQVSNPSGSAPVTWLAVDPSSPDTVYATVSGFAPGIHAFKTINAGGTWTTTGSLAELSGVPANTITIDPGASNTLYLGTDHGIYRSDNAGGAWYRHSNGLPNVPVYAITPDASRGLLYAATHGRGAWLWSSILGRTYVDGPIKKRVLDQPVFGQHYLPNVSCNVKVMAADGSVCASGPTDAIGGTIHTDAEGNLVTTQANKYVDMPIVWACTQGNCLGTDVRRCLGDLGGRNPGPSGVEVDCGGGVKVSKAPGPTGTPNPPSSRFLIGEKQPGPAGTGGQFVLLPAVQTGDGVSQIFCAPPVSFVAGDTDEAILGRAMDRVNSDPNCLAAGVSAQVEAPQAGQVEDEFPQPASLSLAAPDLTGGKLIAGLRIQAGQAMGTCFSAGDLGDLMRGRIRSMKLQFATGPGGASGGPIRILEQSLLGQCDITVPAPAGASGAGVAAAVAAAFQSGGIPSLHPACPVESNPRDLYASGDSVLTSLATDLTICLNDPAVGVSLLPTEVCTTNADCDDGNPCTTDICTPADGKCHATPASDGTPCDDASLCTVGNTCVAGACGTPVACSDGNPCTTDVCNPATGACSSTPLACDDGNPCTIDTCNAAGACVFTAAPGGSSCSDGDPCTTGDACVFIPGSLIPICQGTAQCDDGNPCSADTCDPATGACINTPIVCDDANPCTADACLGGSCVSTPLPAGSVCDDADLCTTGGTCQVNPLTGQATCSSLPVTCDDGDACTMDSCNPTTGGCAHTPLATSEVPTGFQFTSASAMTWPAVSGASFYNTYRGTIPAHMMGSRPPAGPLYDQTCFEYGDAHGDGATISTDASAPPVGTAFYYLVSEETGCGESSVGSDWNGTPIPNTAPCSNPAPPALQIVKSHSGDFTQGQTGATYTLVVSNSGPGPTFGTVTVTELPPAGLTLVSMAGPGWSCPASPGNTCARSDTLGAGLAWPPITVTVNVASTAASPQVNQATVSGGGSSTATSSDSTVIVVLAPSLGVVKSHVGHFHRGQTGALYTVTVSNTGNAPTNGTVTVTDNAPVGLSNVSMSGTGWTCPSPGSTCTRSDALAANSSWPDITVSVDVAPDAPIPTLTNQVSASGGGSPTATASDPTTIDYPILAILKSHVGNFVQGQQGAVFTLRVEDQGFGPTVGTVTVTEIVPAGLTLASMSGTGWSCPAPPANTCTRSDSLASTDFYPDITVTVNVASNAPSSVTNEADIVGGGSVGTGKGFDFVTIDPAQAVLGVTKSHTGNFTQGQQGATYTVTVSNTGNAPTTGTITVTETVPSGLVLVSMAGTGWTCPSPGNTCSRSDALAPGASYPAITVTVNVLATATSPQVNQVSAGQPGVPPATTTDSTVIDPGVPALAITKTHNGNFSQGQTNALYKVTVSNSGPVPTVGPVHVDEAPPAGLTLVSMAGTGWTCAGLHCNRSDPLPSGASYPDITVTVNVLATATSPQVNMVNAGGGGAGTVMASDSTTIIPAGVPNLSITKTHTGTFTRGQNGTYTVNVANASGAGATTGTMTVTETLPPGVTLVSMAGLTWSCVGTTCTRGAAMNPGTSANIIVTVNVLPTATSPQTNQVNVSGGGSAPASASDPTIIVGP
jgi:uncharacterized repeat protein (TIGR01451 family)